MKKQLLVIIGLLMIVLAALSPAPKRVLLDIVSQSHAAGFSINWPPVRWYIEPFSGAAEYLLSFTRYIVQLAAWMFWLSALAFLTGFYRKQSLKEILLRALKFEVCFLSVVMMCLMLPFPAPRLEAPPDYQIADFHSHTFYSHDGLVSPLGSLYYHKRLGFDSFFVTEHGLTSSFDRFPKDTLLKTVYPGMQVSTTERVSLLVLADRPYDAEPFLHQSVKNVIDLAHRNGFIVVCPHWWKWRYFTWQQLYDFGIDGFEIYNAGYRKFSDAERAKMIAFCRDKNLLMTGSTDWHGWGYLSNVWTAVENPVESTEKTTNVSFRPKGEILDSSKFPHARSGLGMTIKNGIRDEIVNPAMAGQRLQFESLRKHLPTKVLVLGRPDELQNTFRYTCEPFFGLYYYFGSLNRKQVFSWLAWIVLFIIARRSGLAGAFARFAPAVLCAVFAGIAVWSVVIWLPLLPENQVLGKLIAPVFLGIAAGWFLVFKFKNK